MTVWRQALWGDLTLQGWEVSSAGQVRSWFLRGGAGRMSSRPYLLKGWVDSKGYVRLTHSSTHRNRTVKLHQVVARTFLGPCPDRMVVCHSDGDPANNAVSNLRYDSVLENHADRERHGRTARGEQGNNKLTESQVLAIRARYTGERGEQSRLAKEFGVTRTLVSYIVRRKIWKHI